MQSLVQRQFRSIVPSVIFTLVVVGVFVDVLISKKLEKEFDELLITKSNGLVALTEDGAEGFEIEHYEITLPNYTDTENPDYFEFVSDQGDIIEKSLSLQHEARLPEIHSDQSGIIFDTTLPDGRAGRLMRTRFLPRIDFDVDEKGGESVELAARFLDFPGSANDGKTISAISGLGSIDATTDFQRMPLTLQLASSRENLDSLIRSMHFLLITAGLVTIATILYLLKRGTNRAMRPLQELADQVATLDECRLDQRLVLDNPVTELSMLTERFNFLLNRLQQAFDRESRFSGDMAHELRTPVSEIRSLLDVNKRWPDEPELVQHFINDVDTATARMQRIIENLLTLARSQKHAAKLVICDDLGQLIAQKVSALKQCANERQITFDVQLAESTVACAGLDQWNQILDNLLCNAVQHCEPGTTINVALSVVSSDNAASQLVIVNSAPDLDDEDVTAMFERLWQKDASRTSDQHSGLGLALVSVYAEQIGATIDAELTKGRLTISVIFPLSR